MIARHRLAFSIALVATAAAGLAGVWWVTRQFDDSTIAQTDASTPNATAAPGTLLADAAGKLKAGKVESAVTTLELLPAELPQAVHSRALELGDQFRDAGQLSAAEELYRRVLRSSDAVGAHERLGHILALEGRGWEATPHLTELLRRGQPSVFGLFLLGDAETYFFPRTQAEALVTQAPDDPMTQLAMAQVESALGNASGSERRLRQITAVRPESAEAQAMLGLILVERSDGRDFLEWNLALPKSCEAHPDVWLARALWARKGGDLHGAARCFWEALRRQPDHRLALTQLAQVLLVLKPADAAAYQQRATQLQQLHDVVIELHKQYPQFKPDALELIREAAVLCESLGRLWEAAGWSLVGLQLDPESSWPQELLAKLKTQLSADLPHTVQEAHPAWTNGLASFPLPTLPRSSETGRSAEVSATASIDDVRFEDDAVASGIDFHYFNSADEATEGARIFETTGGGVAVLDFDCDHRPDLLFTQGCQYPFEAGQRSHLDRFYRNLSGQSFSEVTASTGIQEDGFSQGASAGDIDNDGFPDLFVANLGPNRLFRNNGDGTFTDVTEAAGVVGDDWTTSIAIADINGDSFADIVEVNYLAGPEIFQPPCLSDGRRRVCHPISFPPAQNRLLLGDGEGGFRDVTAESRVAPHPRNGLGIVAADLADTDQLDLFVATDMQPNLLFVNEGGTSGTPLFAESAAAVGLAYDQGGHPQACMGVAAGDADGNGLIDLFVTNFLRESNTLYLQEAKGLYRDASRESGLAESSLNLLGFGTQFLDAELDGWPDLVMTNGHIDDFSFRGDPYKMRPQFFSNRGNAHFVEAMPATLGPWFGIERLGRGLAVLDWNGDGREDFAVSHINAPAALLTNQTPSRGHFLAVQLRGTQCARDAIGASIEVEAGGRRWTRQLTAGDGYQSSNERRLVFGLGDRTRVDSVSVQWPSGQTQRFPVSEANTAWLIVEGHPKAMRLSR